MTEDNRVAEHYSQDGLFERLTRALQAAGHALDHLAPDALAGAEEFHLGGRLATNWIIEALALQPEAHVLDVGCGIGGPARTIAQATGCRVTGVDLTESFVDTANALSRLVGLAERTSFAVANALALPFEESSFDAVITIHVGMNIQDKDTMLTEMARVVRPGGTVLVYDVMRVGQGEIAFPVPWASEPAQDFLAPRQTYEDAMQRCGLTVERTTDRTAACLDLVAKARANPPKITLGDLMGRDWPVMFGNALPALRDGIIAVIEIVARR